ncbi:tetratricopeptide repeat protein [Mucilaginibacter sp. dw_454]|uniref:tetratricopeptide repeat protein n=1 Tax=Mucilaginibacter sp. dw_454 TaxID=2720079 RepID=UPI001BD636E9|nr:tetratricopeptide repeat protein [Mucilaginibacter sp. dw_454]
MHYYFKPFLLLILLFSSIAVFAQDTVKDVPTLMKEAKDLLKQRKMTEASVKFDELLKIDPVNTDALFNKGFCLLVTGKRDEALPCFEKLTTITNTLYPNAYEYMGDIYSINREFDKATALYSKAAALMPRNPQVWYSLGSAYLNGRKFAQAESAEAESIKLNDHFSNNQQFYGIAAMCQGRNAEAVLGLSTHLMWAKPGDKNAAESYRLLKFMLKPNPKATIITDPIAKMQQELLIKSATAAVAGKTNLTPVDSLTLQLTSIFKAIKEQQDQYGSPFFSKYYGDFFDALAATENMDTFVHLISLNASPDNDAWLKSHPDKMTAFVNWTKNTKRQTE